MRRVLLLPLAALLLLGVVLRPLAAQVTWNVDNTTTIGGAAVVNVLGSPRVVDTPFGEGLHFDGDDGVIVDANPIAGAAAYTIEMLFRPDPIENPSSAQPRILHVQSPIPPDHRATLEARVTGDQWYLDAFVRSQRPGQSNPSVVNSLAIIDDTKLHPLGRWYNFTMTYDGETLAAYLNGELELEGDLSVLATVDGQVSLGMRHNQVNFFEGVIAKVRFTPSVVDPADFLSAVAPGDYDRSGAIDAADYDAWRASYGTVADPTGDGADGNRDGLIDAADYTVWRDHLTGDASATDATPAPNGLALLAAAAGLLSRSPRDRER